jgi:hypothetical protein
MAACPSSVLMPTFYRRMALMAADQWYWCLDHGAAEPATSACPPDRRMGPYESSEAAAHWKDRVEARNEQWDADDTAWEDDDRS